MYQEENVRIIPCIYNTQQNIQKETYQIEKNNRIKEWKNFDFLKYEYRIQKIDKKNDKKQMYIDFYEGQFVAYFLTTEQSMLQYFFYKVYYHLEISTSYSILLNAKNQEYKNLQFQIERYYAHQNANLFQVMQETNYPFIYVQMIQQKLYIENDKFQIQKLFLLYDNFGRTRLIQIGSFLVCIFLQTLDFEQVHFFYKYIQFGKNYQSKTDIYLDIKNCFQQQEMPKKQIQKFFDFLEKVLTELDLVYRDKINPYRGDELFSLKNIVYQFEDIINYEFIGLQLFNIMIGIGIAIKKLQQLKFESIEKIKEKIQNNENLKFKNFLDISSTQQIFLSVEHIHHKLNNIVIKYNEVFQFIDDLTMQQFSQFKSLNSFQTKTEQEIEPDNKENALLKQQNVQKIQEEKLDNKILELFGINTKMNFNQKGSNIFISKTTKILFDDFQIN